MTQKHKIQIIPFEAKIKLEIPGAFYARIQQLAFHYSQSRPADELIKAMDFIKENKDADSEFGYHVQTLTALMFEIEKAAKEQELLKDEEIDIPEGGPGDSISESEIPSEN